MSQRDEEEIGAVSKEKEREPKTSSRRSYGQTITQGWDGTFTQLSTSVTIANASSNGLLVPGASVNPGFNASWNCRNTNPTAFTLNGQACSVV